MKDPNSKLRVLIAGCGNMGASHAMAYQQLSAFEIAGLVSRGDSNKILNDKLGGNYPLYNNYEEALISTRPDAVCIASYPNTHEIFARQALELGCHVFIEKPMADSVTGAQRLTKLALNTGKKMVVGYILRHHPSWQQFINISRSLGKPLVMRMNLNQQSHGRMWTVHQNLMQALSPVVDCGVHYIDVMCQITGVQPVQVSAIGARLTDTIPRGNYNYGQLQIRFEDGSVGWYEAGWGPMISETAFFIKDVIGPRGAVSIVARQAGGAGKSDSVEDHTKTESIRVHYATLDANNEFTQPDEWLAMNDEPDHQQLCIRQQKFFLKAIQDDIDLTTHLASAVNNLRIVYACDESIRTGQTIFL